MTKLSKFQIIRARNDFGYFNDLFKYPPPQYESPPMHREWETLLEDAYGLYNKIVLLAPRSAAKSERVTINYPSWMIGKKNDLRISIVSTPQDKATSFLSKIILRIEDDEIYRQVFGNLKPTNPKLWRTDAITIKRNIASKDPSISAVGTMGQAVSKRADLIVLDDPLDGENTKTKYQRESMKKWFQESLDPILEPSGLMIAIMTPWHEDDLSQYLMKQPGWIVKKYPVIMNPDANFDLWKETDDGGLTVWPQKYGYMMIDRDHNGQPILDARGQKKFVSFLMSKYLANVDTFMSQYMLDPFSITGTIFNEKWLKFFTPADFELIRRNCLIYQGWDLAMSLDERADFTACATIAHDLIMNYLYVLEIWRQKLEITEQVSSVKDKFDQWSVVAPIQQITIESDQYQEALSMGLIATTTLPIVGSKSKGRAKLDRIGMLGPHFQNGRIKLAASMQDGEFVYEYKRFPKGSHDDQLDCMEKCLEPILGKSGKRKLIIEGIPIGDPYANIRYDESQIQSYHG